ncbi:MAG TPA: DUF4157 domain-containing protein [Terriglobales bacterium]
MSEKATATAAPEKASSRGQGTKDNGGPSSRLVADNPFLGLQQSVGNQATLRLLDGAVIQTKLRVSQPGDADEQEADRIAAQVVSSRNAPTIQRKCACSGGTPCAKCASEEEETIHRSVQLPQVRSEESIQRAPAEGTSPAKPGQHHGTHPLVVEDDAKDIEPHQMRRSQFIALLRTDACATADAVLMSVGHTTKGCPYIKKWLSFYEKQNSHHIESAMQKYAPETARARSAHEAIRLLTVRIQKAATSWAKTGKVEGLPPEIASQIKAGKSLLEKAHDFATTGVAGAIFGFIGGKGKKEEETGSDSVMRKATTADSAPAHDAASVRSQLGTGHSLDGRVQSQMSSAFGYDFSGVRVHTDSKASTLSSNLQARAFTIGNDVAFASNEYRPGTLIGDALIAHELAHVVQQGGGNSISTPQRKAEGDDTSLERDADRAAATALFANWPDIQSGIGRIRKTAVPALRSGLKLQSCKSTASTSAPGWTVDELKANLTTCDGTTGAHTALQSVTVQVGSSVIGTGGSTAGSTITLDPGQSKCAATQILIQELTNYSHQADFTRIQTDAQAGNLGKEEYTRREEEVEYDGVKKVIATFDACKDRWGCTTCVFEGARGANTFNAYYPRESEDHKNYYRNLWESNYKAAYDAKHPPAPPPAHH